MLSKTVADVLKKFPEVKDYSVDVSMVLLDKIGKIDQSYDLAASASWPLYLNTLLGNNKWQLLGNPPFCLSCLAFSRSTCHAVRIKPRHSSVPLEKALASAVVARIKDGGLDKGKRQRGKRESIYTKKQKKRVLEFLSNGGEAKGKRAESLQQIFDTLNIELGRACNGSKLIDEMHVECSGCGERFQLQLGRPGAWKYFKFQHFDDQHGVVPLSKAAQAFQSLFGSSKPSAAAKRRNSGGALSVAVSAAKPTGPSKQSNMGWDQNQLLVEGQISGELACSGIAVRIGVLALVQGCLCASSLKDFAIQGLHLWNTAAEGEKKTVVPSRLLLTSGLPGSEADCYEGTMLGGSMSQSLAEALNRAVPASGDLVAFVLTDSFQRSMLLLC